MDTAQLESRLLSIPGVARAMVVDSVDSTNLRVAEMLGAGSGVHAVVVAGHQSAGRGRRGREWLDVPDGNVAVSLGVELPTQAPGLVPLAAALAVREVLQQVGATTSLKWPNDVRLVTDGRPRKTAGILVEGHPGSTPPAAIIGVGVNTDWRGRHPAQDAARDWISLAEAVRGDVDRADLVVALVTVLRTWHRRLLADPSQVMRSYRAACDTIGRRVGIHLGPGTATAVAAVDGRLVGTATDIDHNGCLVVATGGRAITVAAGDVVHLRPVD